MGRSESVQEGTGAYHERSHMMFLARRLRLLTIATGVLCVMVGGCSADNTAVGTWKATDNANAFLVLESNGSVTGNDGCNHLGGEWAQDADTIEFSRIFSTLMFCEGVDTWLSHMTSARVNGNEMSIFDESGEPIGTLHK